MGKPADNITIHTKRLYRVILEGIDTDLETPDGFAVKLASRLHVPLPRAKLVARCLPYTAKSGLDAAQANRLKTLLDEIGGKARVEPHFVTPPDPGERETNSPRPSGEGKATFVCPGCGCEHPTGAKFCSFCLRKFRDPLSRLDSLEEKLPKENPLDINDREAGIDWSGAVRSARRRPLPIMVGVIVLLIIFILLK